MSLISKSGLAKKLNKKSIYGILTQASTDAPTFVERFNSADVTLTWGRASAGVYSVTASGKFTETASFLDVNVGNPYILDRVVRYISASSDPTKASNPYLVFNCYDFVATPAATDLAGSVPIEIVIWE
jgi:hypothetical protein